MDFSDVETLIPVSLAALVAALPSMGFALSVIFAIFVQN